MTDERNSTKARNQPTLSNESTEIGTNYSSTKCQLNEKINLKKENKEKNIQPKSKHSRSSSSREASEKTSEKNSLCSDRRPSSSQSKKAPPIGRIDSANRRTPTPTKQVQLLAVKRVEERSWSNGGSSVEQYMNNKALMSNWTDPLCSHNSSNSQGAANYNISGNGNSTQSRESTRHAAEIRNGSGDNITGGTRGSDDEVDDDDESSDEEPVKAPNELFMEFLECVMNSDFVNGLKLCKMILIYEPDNAQALSFQSLIQDKIAFDAEETEEESGSRGTSAGRGTSDNEESSSSDDDEDDDDEDDDDDDDDDDEDDEDDDDDTLQTIQEIISNGPTIT